MVWLDCGRSAMKSSVSPSMPMKETPEPERYPRLPGFVKWIVVGPQLSAYCARESARRRSMTRSVSFPSSK